MPEAKPIAILVLDFDGPVNSWSNGESFLGDSMAAKRDSAKSKIATEGGAFVDNTLAQRCIYIAHDDSQYLAPILASLAANGVTIVCGSQRMAVTLPQDQELKTQMFTAFDTAFGKDRQFLLSDEALETTLAKQDSTKKTGEQSQRSNESKNGFLETTQNHYKVQDKGNVLLADDDNKTYEEKTKESGYGFIHIPSLAMDITGHTTPESVAARKAAYVKMWLVTLSKAIDPEKLAKEVAAKQKMFSEEFDYLMENDTEAKEILLVSFALKLCDDYLKEHPLTEKDNAPKLRADANPYLEEEDSPQSIVRDIKNLLSNALLSLSFNNRIEKTNKIIENQTVTKIMGKCSWGQRFLLVLKNFFTGQWKTMTMSPAEKTAQDMGKLMQSAIPTQEAKPTPTNAGGG